MWNSILHTFLVPFTECSTTTMIINNEQVRHHLGTNCLQTIEMESSVASNGVSPMGEAEYDCGMHVVVLPLITTTSMLLSDSAPCKLDQFTVLHCLQLQVSLCPTVFTLFVERCVMDLSPYSGQDCFKIQKNDCR